MSDTKNNATIGDNYVIFDPGYSGTKIVPLEKLNFNFFDYSLKELKRRKRILSNPNCHAQVITKNGLKKWGYTLKKK